MNDYARAHPAHRRSRELGARMGRLAPMLEPQVSALLAPVAAHAHVHDRGAPPVGLVRGAPAHRVTRLARASAASTPLILTSDPAIQQCMIWLNAPARRLQPLGILECEHAQVRAIKGSSGHVELFRMEGVGISYHRKTSTPYTATIRPTSPTTPTSSNAKSHESLT